jgi:hypothetical protein
MLEWYWQGETEVLGLKTDPAPLCPPQTSYGLTWDRIRASAPRNIFNGSYREHTLLFYPNTMINQVLSFVICSRQWAIFIDSFVLKNDPLVWSYLQKNASLMLKWRDNRQNSFYPGSSRFWAQPSLVSSTLFLVPSAEFLNTWSYTYTPPIRLPVVKLNEAPSNKTSTDFTSFV